MIWKIVINKYVSAKVYLDRIRAFFCDNGKCVKWFWKSF